MQINIIKKHSQYPLGIADVDEKRAEYLIRVGVAERVESDIGRLIERTEIIEPWMLKDFGELEKDEVSKSEDFVEKLEIKIPKKEKIETKSGNVPTAKKSK